MARPVPVLPEVSLAPLALGADFAKIVVRAVAYEEHSPAPTVRDEPPNLRLVVIFDTDRALRVGGRQLGPAFVAGPSLRPVRTAHDGRQRGIELRLEPWASRELFGVDAHELHGRVVPLAELTTALPRVRDGAPLTRDDLVAWLGPALRTAPDLARSAVRHGVRRLVESQGRTRIAELAAELGYSTGHLVGLFRRHAGASPKQVARLARLRAFLDLDPDVGLSEAALRLGFSDQAHLSREIKAMTGRSPTVLRSDRGFVQDPGEGPGSSSTGL